MTEAIAAALSCLSVVADLLSVAGIAVTVWTLWAVKSVRRELQEREHQIDRARQADAARRKLSAVLKTIRSGRLPRDHSAIEFARAEAALEMLTSNIGVRAEIREKCARTLRLLKKTNRNADAADVGARLTLPRPLTKELMVIVENAGRSNRVRFHQEKLRRLKAFYYACDR